MEEKLAKTSQLDDTKLEDPFRQDISNPGITTWGYSTFWAVKHGNFMKPHMWSNLALGMPQVENSHGQCSAAVGTRGL